jgi:hypothetical protein
MVEILFTLVYMSCLIFSRKLAHGGVELKGLNIVVRKLRRLVGHRRIRAKDSVKGLHRKMTCQAPLTIRGRGHGQGSTKFKATRVLLDA